MNHNGHFDLVCEKCGKRIGGCRCICPGKEKKPSGLCDECKTKNRVDDPRGMSRGTYADD